MRDINHAKTTASIVYHEEMSLQKRQQVAFIGENTCKGKIRFFFKK